MSASDLLQISLFLVLLMALVKPLGSYMADVFEGRPCFMDKILRPLELWIYRLSRVSANEEMGWKTYAVSMLLFNALGFLAVYLLQRVQGHLPLDPQGLGVVSPDSAFNTAASFVTNTNW